MLKRRLALWQVFDSVRDVRLSTCMFWGLPAFSDGGVAGIVTHDTLEQIRG